MAMPPAQGTDKSFVRPPTPESSFSGHRDPPVEMGVVSTGDVARPSSNSLDDLANVLTVRVRGVHPSSQERGRPRHLDRKGLAGRQSERLPVVSGDAQSAVDRDGDGGCFPVVDMASKFDEPLYLVVTEGYERHPSASESVAVERLSIAGRIEWIQPQDLGGDNGGHEEPDVGRSCELLR